ncbi:MAG: hypothetical protein ACRCTY_03965 [Candidatus Adiutrix sp.]
MNHNCEIAFTKTPKTKDLPPIGFLTGAGFDCKLLRKTAPSEMKSAPPLLGGFCPVTTNNNFFLAGPVLGAPMGVMALEELIRRGAKKIIFMGLAGSLSKKIAVASLCSPTKGLSTEGTSAHYPAPLKPDEDMILKAQTLGLDTGATIWSTDAIFRETLALIEKQRRGGADLVDMESTALWAAAKFRQIQLVTVVVVSDIIDGATHRQANHWPEFKEALPKAAQIGWNLAQLCLES